MGVWEYVSVGVAAYLLGSIPFGVIASRAFHQADVRAVGSGHTGMLNTYRAAGLIPAVLTLLGDGAKGLLAVLVARAWLGESWAIPLAASLVVIGHCFPLYTRLHGGMGLATGGGVLLWLQPLVLVGLIVAWFPLKWLLRESLYASLAVAVLLPLALLVVRADEFTVAAGIGVGAVLFLRHLQVLLEQHASLHPAE
jgi:acyl phosphate:glycerol-3-phosphate acyltransferase